MITEQIQALARRVANDSSDAEAAEMLTRPLLRAGHGPAADQILARLDQRAPAKAIVLLRDATTDQAEGINRAVAQWLTDPTLTALTIADIALEDIHIEVFGDLGPVQGRPVEVIATDEVG